MSKIINLDTTVLYDVTVIGAGPAAISSAIYSARKGLKVAIIGEFVGGQVFETNDIENIIGMPLTNGFEFSMLLEKHLSEYEVAFYKGHLVKEIKDDKEKTIILDDEKEFKTRTVIIATGAKRRKLGVEGENEFSGKGVHYCATCDGPFYRNKDVVVVGGGNSGVEAAIDLSNIAKSVTLVEFLPELKADEVLQNKLNSLENVKIYTNTKVDNVKGTQFLENVNISNRDTEEKITLTIDGLFVEIGLEANTGLVKDLVKLNKRNEIVIDNKNMTTCPGIFAAGDCTEVEFKQIIIAMGEGAKAALGAFEYLVKN